MDVLGTELPGIRFILVLTIMEFFFGLLVTVLILGPLGVVIYLVVRVSDLSRRVDRLEGRPAGADIRPATATPVQTSRTHPAAAPSPAKSTAAGAPPAAIRPDDLKIDRGAASARREELESMIGGKLMNRVGALALIIGVGFFLKYAFDNNWITETTRVLIGAGIGGICLVGGKRTHAKGYGVFAQGLVGAGIAILYLSLYASFNFYHLIPQWVAFLLMSGVTALTLAQALSYDSLAVSVLGWAGGFLTPVMLSTGESNEIALFTYLALLSVGLLSIALRKESWVVLEPLTLLGTYAMYVAWNSEFYTPAAFALTLFYLTLFWLILHASDIARVRLGLPQYPELRHVVQTVNAVVYYCAVYLLLYDSQREAIGSVTFGLGIVYATTVILIQRLPGNGQVLQARNGLLAATFLLIGTAVEFKQAATLRLWPLEALALLWLGTQFGRMYLRVSAMVFFTASIVLFFFSTGTLQYTPIEEFHILINARALTALIVAGALGAATLLVARARDSSTASLRPWLGFSFFMILFVLLTVETNDAFRQVMAEARSHFEGRELRDSLTIVENQRQLCLSGIWLLYSIIVMVVGILRRARGPRILAIGLFGLSIIKIFVVDLSFLQTLYRIFSFIGLGVILLTVSYMYQRYKTFLFGPKPSTDKSS